MTKHQFQEFWDKKFPQSPPINFLFKHNFSDRWLRIHSLPNSKRYADTDEDWTILLNRQHHLFKDLMSQKENIFVLFGLYSDKKKVFEKNIFEEHEFIKSLSFEALESIDLFSISKDWFDEGVLFTPFFAKATYVEKTFTSILKSIANDELRVFFLNAVTNTIIAPYDGGVDLIFNTSETRNSYKLKYKEFLSDRDDGL